MVTQEELEQMSPEEIAKLQKENCIFCKLISGQIPSQKIYEDTHTIAILDINPATKGHILILPKEHYPVLPLMPPDVFDAVFKAAQLIAKGAKKAVLAKDVTLFIANGGVAGQQSPHALFHLIPRDNGDGLDNLIIPQNNAMVEKNKELYSALQNNLTIMCTKRFGTQSQASNKPASQNEKSEKTAIPKDPLARQEMIAQMIETQTDVRNLLMNDPDAFKKTIQQDAQLMQLFNGVNIDALSEQLNAVVKPEEKQVVELKKSEQTDSQNIQSVESSVQDYSKQPQTTEKKPEIFLGENPYKQRDAVFAYFEQKPKAKEVLLNDVQYFKELLSQRPDIQELFKDVDIDKLAKKLSEQEQGETHE